MRAGEFRSKTGGPSSSSEESAKSSASEDSIGIGGEVRKAL